MSAFLTNLSFENRLKTAFRGSAKEQKVAIEELRKEKRPRPRPTAPAPLPAFTPKPTLGASSNVFKSNLGGTLGSTR